MSDTQFVPTGPARPNSVYLSWRLYKALGLVARKTGRSREEIAECVLDAWIFREHLEIDAWLKGREADEEEFIKNLKPVPFA